MDSNPENLLSDSISETLASPLPLLASLLLNQHLITAIEKLAYEQATPVQAKTIPLALAGKDLLISAETGSGKTAAFLLPCLQKLLAATATRYGIQMLVLAPTRELAQQITVRCQELIADTDLEVGLIIGSDEFKKQQTLLRKNPSVLVATPGRLLELLNQDVVNFDELKILILDEADRMLDMGFSPDVLAIAEHCNSQRQTLLLSATLTSGVLRVAKDLLINPETVEVDHFRNNQHANIRQQIIPSDDTPHKQKQLLWLLTHEKYKKALVFTNTKVQAELLSEKLRGGKLRINVLHGDMDQPERNRVMALYRKGSINVLIATDLAARGLDIDEIQLVINFDMARNANSYVHRIGRTGRADAQGLAISLINSNEWNLMVGIERYLNQHLERRIIQELAGSYNGPKKLKKSGKAALAKKKVAEKKAEAPKVKVRLRDKKNIGKRRVPTPKVVVESTTAQNDRPAEI
jgi:superfamily II DNA/RNA helicase